MKRSFIESFKKSSFSKAQLAAFVLTFGLLGGYLLIHSFAAGNSANLWVDTNGGTCTRQAAAGAYVDAQACSNFGAAMSAAQPGDLILVKTGSYTGQTISRQSGAVTPKVTIKPEVAGSVDTGFLTICGYGMVIQDFHGTGAVSTGFNATFNNGGFYLGDNSCNGANQTVSNHDIDLVGIHYPRGTIRGTTLSLQNSEIGPNYPCQTAGDPGSIEDNLRLWPDGGAWTSSNGIMIKGNYIHDDRTENPVGTFQHDCGAAGAHADLYQTIGVTNVTFDSNVFYDCSADFMEEGTINGTTIGNETIQNNFFSACQDPGAKGADLGSDTATLTGPYIFRNNTVLGSYGFNLYGLNAGTVGSIFANNYMYVGSSQSFTCGAGTYSNNAFPTSNGVTCGTGTKRCSPAFANAGAGSFGVSSDLHISASDTCLKDSGGSTNIAATDIDGDSRPQGAASDIGADEYVAPAGSANIFMSTSGSDSGSNCKRFASLTDMSTIPANTACATMSKAISLAQAGDIIQLEPGNYGNLLIDRQSGLDSPKVVVRGDPNLPNQQKCPNDPNSTPVCAAGNVLVTGMTLCGHGLSVQNMDVGNSSQWYTEGFYVGLGNTCAGVNMVTSNFNIELRNVHFFSASTLRCHDCGLYNSRIGPNELVCQNTTDVEGDNLHIWPDASSTPWTVPSNVTIDHNLIYDANHSDGNACRSEGRDDHSDLIQTLGYANLTVTNNILWKCASSFWQDGVINGSGISGTNTWANNSFVGPCSSGGTFQIGDSANCAGTYLFEGNTWITNSPPRIDCPNAAASSHWYDNFIYINSTLSNQNCGFGTWDYNRLPTSSDLTSCGTHFAKCDPTWLYPTVGTADFVHGWDAEVSPTDTCLKDAGSPTNFLSPDLLGASRPQGAAPDIGAYELSSGGGGGTCPQGDLNGDCHVTITDLSILLSHYGQAATASQGDINTDGIVTILDLSILLSHYGS